MGALRKWAIALIGLTSCEPALRASDLVGRYRLIDNHEAIEWNGSSELSIRADGTFEQSCGAVAGPVKSVSGRWERNEGNIWLTRFIDCAGVFGRPVSSGASLIVEGGNPPIILVDPDLNVFYERE